MGRFLYFAKSESIYIFLRGIGVAIDRAGVFVFLAIVYRDCLSENASDPYFPDKRFVLDIERDGLDGEWSAGKIVVEVGWKIPLFDACDIPEREYIYHESILLEFGVAVSITEPLPSGSA